MKPKPSSSPLAIHVIGAKPGAMVEIVPGKTYLALAPSKIETIGIHEWVPAGDGTYRAMVRVSPRWFTVSRRDFKKLQIAISESSLRRLIRAGLVTGHPVTPGCTQFDYFSYLGHMATVAAAPEEFWDRKEPGQNFTNRERYRQAL